MGVRNRKDIISIHVYDSFVLMPPSLTKCSSFKGCNSYLCMFICYFREAESTFLLVMRMVYLLDDDGGCHDDDGLCYAVGDFLSSSISDCTISLINSYSMSHTHILHVYISLMQSHSMVNTLATPYARHTHLYNCVYMHVYCMMCII